MSCENLPLGNMSTKGIQISLYIHTIVIRAFAVGHMESLTTVEYAGPSCSKHR